MLMQFLPFVRMTFIVFFFAIVITQILWPLLRGTRLFPFFRHERDLENDLAKVKQKNLEKDIEKEIRNENERNHK